MIPNEASAQEPRAPSEQPGEDRLRLLLSTGDDQGERDALRLGLQQAVGALAGLGGLAHLRGRQARGGVPLRLSTSIGLPRNLTRGWVYLADHDRTAPGRATAENIRLWLPTTADTPGPLPPGSGVAAVPLPGSEGPLGALSVVTAGDLPPTDGQWDLLERIAAWVADRLGRPAPAEPRQRWRLAERRPGTRLPTTATDVGVGTWEWNVRTGEAFLDDAAQHVFGMPPDMYDGRIETWVELVHPEDLPWVIADAEDAARAVGGYAAEYRVRRPDGGFRWVQARGRSVHGDDGRPLLLRGVLWDSTETRVAMDTVGRALRHMSDGFLALAPDGRIIFANAQADRLLGTPGRTGGRILWDLPGVGPSALEARCREAARSGTPVSGDIAWDGGQRTYRARVMPVPDGLTVYLTDVSERRRAEEAQAKAAQGAADRAAHIGRLTTALAEAVTVNDVVHAVAERVLPLFDATGLIIQTLEGDFLRAVGFVGYPPDLMRRTGREQLTPGTPGADALRDRMPLYITSAREYVSLYPNRAELREWAQKHAWAFLPLIVSGKPVGCCVVSFSEPRPFTEEERTLLTALAGLIAQALERARLYDAEHGRAQELQRGLLPRTLPVLPAVTAAARYLPATEGTTAGGDWYDVIPLSADRTALVIGDVMGHGISEAVTMGRLRTAVHTLAGLELPPDELMAHLNDLVSDLGDDFYATCLYAVYDPAAGRCALARAGHPPPALVRPDGTVHFVGGPPDPPLGAATPPFALVELEVPDRSLLALYSDGLVESSRRDIDTGMAELAEVLTRALTLTPAAPGSGGRHDDRRLEVRRLERLCEQVCTALGLGKGHAGDDAALLIACAHALAPEDMASWSLPEEPVAAGQARDHVRRQLERWGLDDLVTTTELIASELVGNVVRHARGPVGLRLIRSRSLVCEVSDGSLTTPRIRHAAPSDEGGRGLQLVAALCQRWGTRYTPYGKSIWTEQTIPEPDARPGP
ncbi:SpoIIE family protein phosphatase [Streptomyces sp. MI02-7b]|uniref:SpoIIE family protein phosphatase n=1 Tax=Streptomyces sp. MI02-7b TaxID=462941 RepID=UPI0029AFE185|nr:SpoIIE family protein phosphatase [Streptomyces sp. MI02-7b]MDX3071368.1 SpoIIE family protein phosphatase [Streptomyces sp. MI02-7b]